LVVAENKEHGVTPNTKSPLVSSPLELILEGIFPYGSIPELLQKYFGTGFDAFLERTKMPDGENYSNSSPPDGVVYAFTFLPQMMLS
jgi:hypothetical protein